jgi:tetrapyrrole methylase family protein/MazG family protein
MTPALSLRGVRRLLNVVARLRSRHGCPWDRKQTLKSLRPYIIEEAYEMIDAVDSGDADAHMEELGDVLLQVLLHAQIRTEQGRFTFDQVAGRLADKLVRRHPHVFGNVKARNSREVLTNWEKIKLREKMGRAKSLFSGVPRSLPALLRAQRVQAKAARVGFDWTRVTDVMAKVREELAETSMAMRSGNRAHVKEETGDLLFSIVNLCRFQRFSAEEALDATIRKFIRRFQAMEKFLLKRGKALESCTLAEMDAAWNAVKRRP